MFCNLNGSVVPFETAGLPLNDLGIIRGYGYFDYLRTYKGVPFLLDEHLERLVRTAKIMKLAVPYTLDQIKQWILDLLKKNNFPESHIKIVITGGPSEDQMTSTHPSFYIMVTPASPQHDSTSYREGITVMTYEHLRLFPEAKTLNYLTAIALTPEKQKIGAREIIYHYQGNILEASTSNVFIFQENKLVTPAMNILGGITRTKVIELAQNVFPVEERTIPVKEFLSAQEIFITASNKEVMPVTRIDTQQVGTGMVGENTKKMLKLYRDFIKRYIKEHI